MNGGLKTTCVHNPIISMFFFLLLGFWNKRVKGFEQVMMVFLAAHTLFTSPVAGL